MQQPRAASYSLGQRLEQASGRPSGFDYMRLTLAVMVVISHTGETAYGLPQGSAFHTAAGPAVRCILPMFFALSGFLVTGSLERCKTLVSFLGLRVIRIYPALAVEVLLSALLIGPMMTALPLPQYFSSQVFAHYFWNILGHIHYVLPGVFNDNPLPHTVNAQLWTVPYELACYISISALAILGAVRRRVLVPIGAVAISILYVVLSMARHGGVLIEGGEALGGASLVSSFLAGVALYLYRDKLVWSHALGFTLFAISLALMAWVPHGEFIAAFTLSYVTIYLGVFNPKRRWVLKGADYSYGIFLYGFVIQQLVSALLPWTREWYWNLLVALPLTAAFAALSWHMVEKPALGMRFGVKKLEDAVLALLAAWKPAAGRVIAPPASDAPPAG